MENIDDSDLDGNFAQKFFSFVKLFDIFSISWDLNQLFHVLLHFCWNFYFILSNQKNPEHKRCRFQRYFSTFITHKTQLFPFFSALIKIFFFTRPPPTTSSKLSINFFALLSLVKYFFSRFLFSSAMQFQLFHHISLSFAQ